MPDTETITDAQIMHAVSNRLSAVTSMFVTIARALAHQSLRWLAVVMAFTVTLVAMKHPDQWRMGAAAVFCVLMAPLVWKSPK